MYYLCSRHDITLEKKGVEVGEIGVEMGELWDRREKNENKNTESRKEGGESYMEKRCQQ